jgi:hypothetical protein
MELVVELSNKRPLLERVGLRAARLDGTSSRLELDLSADEIAKGSGANVSWAIGDIS